jgi:endoribonuclease LACTB2
MEYFRYHNTNCYFVKSAMGDRLLAIDAGWPCSFYEYCRELKAIGHAFGQIAWAMATHYHLDHAGLIGEFAARGVACLAFDDQASGIDAMETLIRRSYPNYAPIDKARLRLLKMDQSRKALEELGIKGEVIATEGHSPDSLSFVSDGGEAVIGDLSPLDQIMPDDEKSLRSWELLRSKGAKDIFPAHAARFRL